jgi:hypothetical protein
MWRKELWTGCGLWVVLAMGVPGNSEAMPPKASAESALSLCQRVEALQTLHYLNLTRSQLKRLAAVAQGATPNAPASKRVAASEEIQKLLQDLHDSLAADNDDEHINELLEKYDEARLSDKWDLDEDLEVTEEARERAPKALRILTGSQVAQFVANLGDIDDPRERLLKGLAKVRGQSAEQWETYRQELADDVSHLIAGLDPDRAAKLSDEVIQLLIVARSLKEEEFKTQRKELEKKVDEIVGGLGPTDVIRNVMENALAELLSNPQLAAAIKARLR